MPPIILAIRYLHIAAGFTAFFIAPVAMAVRKGGDKHRLWGKVYFYAMMAATGGALIVAAYRPNFFLLGLSVFSFHMAFVGYRVLFRKRPERDRAEILDWSVTLATFACGIMEIYFGFKADHAGQVLYIVFGIGMLLNASQTIRTYLQKTRPKNEWFFDHMNGMLASYIAAVTAFSAVNFNFLPVLVQWLWPTVIGAPLIAVWVAKYRKKFAKGTVPKDVAIIKIGQENGL